MLILQATKINELVTTSNMVCYLVCGLELRRHSNKIHSDKICRNNSLVTLFKPIPNPINVFLSFIFNVYVAGGLFLVNLHSPAFLIGMDLKRNWIRR